MHKEYIMLNGFRKAKKGFTAGFHVPLNSARKDSNRFSASYRKTAYCCLLLNQVPVESTAHVISTVVKELTDLKAKTTMPILQLLVNLHTSWES